MKAIVYAKYGPPEVLQLKEVEKPTPKDNEVLVKVHGASVNDWDWGLLRGKPFINRLAFGLFKPKTQILGLDIAGRVEAIGSKVKRLKAGDEVFGDISGCSWGGFAEYACAREDTLTLKPAGMSFDEAAAIPQAAILALRGLRNKGHLQPGQKILINGAGGGAGTFAIQIAKSFGAHVTGVDSAVKLEMMRSLGAEHVIDYAKEDFTKNGQHYDLILDLMGYHPFFDYKRSLSPGGTFLLVGGSSALIFKTAFLGPLISMTGSKKMGILMHKQNKDMDFMVELFEAGKVVPIIDRRFPLREVPEAMRYFGSGKVIGKLVITIEETHESNCIHKIRTTRRPSA